MKEYSMTSVAPTVSNILGIRKPAQSQEEIIEEITGDMTDESKIALVVVDAFGVSTWKRFRDFTPNFNLIVHQHLLHIRSVLPAKTPVNFATMVTGAPSDVHAIRDRTQPLEVETLFHVLSEPGMKSAAVGRESSTVGVLLSKFADYKCIASTNTDEELLSMGIEMVKEENPEFMIMQLLDIDETGHKFGLKGPQIEKAVADVDRHLGELMPVLAEMGYGLIILADHGAHQVDKMATHDGSVDDDLIVPCGWRNNVYLRNIYDID
ncbi:PglZ domain-containing protein [Candidatus Poribacteria bacterium]|nr:PglZ domain-containing protein [Candidatus Poribacteria bacterium]